MICRREIRKSPVATRNWVLVRICRPSRFLPRNDAPSASLGGHELVALVVLQSDRPFHYLKDIPEGHLTHPNGTGPSPRDPSQVGLLPGCSQDINQSIASERVDVWGAGLQTPGEPII